MHAASREALDQTGSALQSALAADPAGGATGAKVGAELFEVVDVLEANRTLRVAVADTAASVEARQDLVRGVFGWKIDQATLDLVLAAVAQDWSNPRELRQGLVILGREALLKSAEEQGQLQTVEDELFRLGRVVAGDAELEQALADRAVDEKRRRALLAEILYGKVTAVTEALASQSVRRPSGMPADDLLEISRQAAELRGRSVAVVTSAEPLSDQQSEDLRGRLTSLYGRELAIHNDVDASILGGVVVRIGDEIIDGSVAGRLDAMRRTLR